jgi:hypothetical protein
VTAAVVADRGPDRLGHGVQVAEQLFDGLAREVRRALEGLGQVGDVGRVVLAVVDLHRLFVDVRFQRVVRVGQGGKLEWHTVLSSFGWAGGRAAPPARRRMMADSMGNAGLSIYSSIFRGAAGTKPADRHRR